METLFITPKYLTENTHLDGNTDFANYNFHIANVQMNTIEGLLGTELYDKILEDFSNNSLTGLYEKLFNDCVKPITKYYSISEYISTPYEVGKGGVYKHTGDNRESLTRDEIEVFQGKYNSMAQNYVNRFNKFICKYGKDLPEWKLQQDEVNPENTIVITDIRFF